MGLCICRPFVKLLSFPTESIVQMFRTLRQILMLILACGMMIPVHAEDNVLLWFFNDPVIKDLDGTSYKMDNLPLRGAAAEAEANNLQKLVRISAQDADGDKVYLDLAYKAMPDAWFDGVIIPMTNPETGGNLWKAGPGYADLSGLNLGSPGAYNTALTFAMEIGFAEFDDDGNVANWIVAAYSTESLKDMIDGGHIISSELSVQGSFDWDGGAFSVPEPTSGMLVLIGGALLALRRRRKDIAA